MLSLTTYPGGCAAALTGRSVFVFKDGEISPYRTIDVQDGGFITGIAINSSGLLAITGNLNNNVSTHYLEIWDYANETRLPDSVSLISLYAFSHCSALKTIVLPDGITEIEKDAFIHCTSLVSITLPVSITKILDAFSGCDQLSDVYYAGNQTQWNSVQIDSDQINAAEIHFHAAA